MLLRGELRGARGACEGMRLNGGEEDEDLLQENRYGRHVRWFEINPKYLKLVIVRLQGGNIQQRLKPKKQDRGSHKMPVKIK